MAGWITGRVLRGARQREVAFSCSSRDAGNRISLRRIAWHLETRASDRCIHEAESRVQSRSLDAVSMATEPPPSSRTRPVTQPAIARSAPVHRPDAVRFEMSESRRRGADP